MEIIKVNLSDIKPYENNAKLHPQEQIEQIKKSIQEFGNNDPIAIDEKNIIIEGHGRYEALKQLGYEVAECIRLSHLTDEQKRAYILVHNKLTMNTGFNMEILNLELDQIESIDMSEFDFNIDIGDYEPTERKDLSSQVKETYEVIVECESETEQEEIYNKLVSEGLVCRVLTL